MEKLIFLIALVVPILSAAQADELPKGLKWVTSSDYPTFADPNAKKGGQAAIALPTYPLTFRVIGPDSHSVLFQYFNLQEIGLTELHPMTWEPVPVLATHWAFGKDGRTVFYKLNKQAKWSDGKPIVADDYLFTLDFMKSKHLVAPWYNTFYTDTYESVKKYGENVISVTLKVAKPPLIVNAAIGPTPKHFYGGKVPKDFVTRYNWKPAPRTGPYQITKFKKGKSVRMERLKNWWAKDIRYFKNRFNVDTVDFKVVREDRIEYEWFKGGKLDFFILNPPTYWHERAKEKIYTKGYVERLWFYNDAPRVTYGLWMNKKEDIFKDRDVRLGVQHSMNWQKMIDKVLRGEYQRLRTVSDGYRDYWNQDIEPREFDLKLADKYFTKAGWGKRDATGIRTKGGKRLSASVIYSSDEWTPRLVILKEEAKKAGFELKLKRQDWSAVLKSISASKHEIVLMGFSGYNYPQYWGTWHSDSKDNNLTSTNNKELDGLITSFRNETDEEKKKQFARTIQQKIFEDASFIPSVTTDWVRIGYWRWWRFPSPPATKISKAAASLFNAQWGGLPWFDQQRYDETQKAMKAGKSFKPVTRVDETFRRKG